MVPRSRKEESLWQNGSRDKRDKKAIAVALFASTAWWEAAGEPDPGDLVSMLDHAAIVETMALVCEDSRPDLAAAFKDEQQRWWVRNAQIHQTVASLEREIGTPRANAFLDYFNSLRRSLQQQIRDQQHTGDRGYAAGCDELLEDLTRGRLDYRRSGKPRAPPQTPCPSKRR